ncbi:MAG: HTH-type transcriptional activator RhaR [Lentisphaerae bacterium ADurb.Bin242]|nr:MAG: HTH-type transcriptional activator RhaR [Lentisphaerae bacterium ADurb.Bin242]
MLTKGSSVKVYHLKQFDHTGSRMFVNLQHWKKGDASVEHLHDCMEVMYVLSGNGINFVNSVSYPIIAGDLYIINQSLSHSFFAAENLVFYNLIFSFGLFSGRELQLFRKVDGFDSLFHPGGNRASPENSISKLFLPPPFSGHLKELFDSICRETSTSYPASTLNGKAHLILLLNEICSCRRELKDRKMQIPSLSGSHDSLTRMLDYINRNFQKELSVDEIASVAHLSKTYVGEFFRERTGVTLVKYINTLRMEKARTMLTSEPDKNISEISDACGFQDSSYFTRVFRLTTGFSPTRYRIISAQNPENNP